MARYLLVLDDLDDSPELVDAAAWLASEDLDAEFVLLVPATFLHPVDAVLGLYTSPIALARKRAQRMRERLIGSGVTLLATRLGNASPERAVEDALRFAGYEAVVIASASHPLLHRVHRDLACRLSARFPNTRFVHAGGGAQDHAARA